MSSYQTVTPADTRALSDFLSRNGQLLLPMVQLVEQSRAALDEVIDVTGRAMIELILQVSADQLAGPKSPGKRGGDIRHHGAQPGVVHLKERKLRVSRPRLRHRTRGEVDVPAYESLRTRPRMAQRMMQIMIDGVSTRRYQNVIPAMAESVGISKSAVRGLHGDTSPWRPLPRQHRSRREAAEGTGRAPLRSSGHSGDLHRRDRAGRLPRARCDRR